MKRIFLIAFACILVLVGCASNALTWQEQYDLGIRYLNEGNYNEAIICFTAAIEIDEKNTSAYISRAHAYLKTNQMEKALTDYEKVIEIDNTITEAYTGIADIYYSQNEYEKTNDILEKAEGNVATNSDELYNGKIVKIYSVDGEKVINIQELEKYLSNEWYLEPVCLMYAIDGRTRVTLKSEVEAYKGVGWYIEPVVTMYAADGRTRVTPESEVEAYRGVGWYTEPVVTMYAADGRTRVTLESEVEAHKNVGWYTEPVIIMYAADGRTQVTLESEVEAYKNVGWYTEPVIIMYAADGRTRITLESEIEAYKNVGWHTEFVDNELSLKNVLCQGYWGMFFSLYSVDGYIYKFNDNGTITCWTWDGENISQTNDSYYYIDENEQSIKVDGHYHKLYYDTESQCLYSYGMMGIDDDIPVKQIHTHFTSKPTSKQMMEAIKGSKVYI